MKPILIVFMLLTNAVFDNNGVERVYDYATFVDAHTVEVAGAYTAPHILIATGGHALYPDIPGAQYGITSDGFFELDDVPKRTAVVGAGYIAVEVAGVSVLGKHLNIQHQHNQPCCHNLDRAYQFLRPCKYMVYHETNE